MNHIIHNISVIILTIGIIMMVVYVTKATNNNFLTSEQMLMRRNAMKPTESDGTVYDYKVSKAYKKMFSEPSVLFGYQTLDPDNMPQKLYVK
jgi:uncharacterized protein YxeA